jgi:Dolichyl-phosphate-mannose-protein mannosyltransferase
MLAVGLCFALYVAIAYQVIVHRLLWDDEFFTYYISKAPLSEIWSALSTGADQHPPLFYFITHAFLRLFGESHLSLRLPAMLGVGVMSICIFQFVSKRTSAVYGLVAMLLALCTQAVTYAWEARGYGLMLGFSSVALLSWQYAAEGKRRNLALLGLAIGLAGAVASHYYAILLLFPLGLGEIARSFFRKRIDIPVWLTFLSPGIVALLALPLILSSQTYSGAFWAHPQWRMPFQYYKHMAGVDFQMLAMFVVGALSLRMTNLKSRIWKPESHFHEQIAALGLLAVPFLGVLIAKFKTNAYADRYFVIALLGFAVFVASSFYDWLQGRISIGVILIIGLLISLCLRGHFFLESVELQATASVLQAKYLETTARDARPIVVPEVTAFHRLSYYAPRELAARLVYAAEPQAEIRHLRHDTIDRGLLALRPWFPLRTRRYESEVRHFPKFYVYGYSGDWVWLFKQLTEDRIHGTVIGASGGQLLMSIEQSAEPVNLGGELRLTYGPIVPSEGSSLCDQWTKDKICALFR